MLDYLVRHAIKKVWCSPEQDLQMIIQPHRISRGNNFRGSLDYHKVLWDHTPLPSHNEEYHVFQIGHLFPKLVGLFPAGDKWISLSDVINQTNLMADIYFKDGQQVPRYLCYIRFGRKRNLVISIRDHRNFERLRSDVIYTRFYTNAHFNSERYDVAIDKTVCKGRTAIDTSSIVDFQRQFHDYLNLPGQALAYRNGFLVNDLSPANIVEGDTMEFIYDSTIYRTIDFKVKDLKTFTSVMDSGRKYLLNYDQFNNETIDYKDDIDFYLIKRSVNGQHRGVYYHQNTPSTVRMLTHKDYSVPISQVQTYVNDHRNILNDIDDVVIRLYVRKSGFNRQLTFENSRIFELYKMEPNKVRNAMLGIDSTIDEWRAENLEQSPYTQLMGYTYPQMDPLLVQKAYGYNAMAKYTGDSPVKTYISTDNVNVSDVPIAFQTESTAYEYDKDGLLLEYHRHISSNRYVCKNDKTAFVEFIGGLVSEELDFTFNVNSIKPDPYYNHRFYLCDIVSNTPRWNWSDVSNTDIINLTENGVEFSNIGTMDYTGVLSDKYFLGYRLTMKPKNGVLKFSVNNYETHFDERKRRVSTIPPRRLDLWLNGKALIQNLDYIVKWPEVVISNIEHHNFDEEEQHIDIRATGFCHDDMSIDDQMEYGFVIHGHLSKNNRYNVRDDKVHSIIVGGRLFNFNDKVTYAENEIDLNPTGVENGTPYSLKETIVPLRDLMYTDTYSLRDKSLDLDRRIEDYMSLHHPEPKIDTISPIKRRYELHSPFLSRIIYDLLFGLFPDEQLKVHYSNSDINEWLQEYKYLLDFDPAWLGVDTNYVTVYPHRYSETIELNVYQFNFLKRVAQFYFEDKVEVNHFIRVVIPNT